MAVCASILVNAVITFVRHVNNFGTAFTVLTFVPKNQVNYGWASLNTYIYDVFNWQLSIWQSLSLARNLLLSASNTTSINGLDTALGGNRTHYLRSANFPYANSTNDGTTACVLIAMDQPFTLSLFRANAFTDAANFTTGRLDVQGLTEEGEIRTHQLKPVGLQIPDQQTRQSVNYMDLLQVPLKSLSFTYSRGNDNLSFLMQLQGTYYT